MHRKMYAAFCEAGRGACLSKGTGVVSASSQFFSPVRPIEIMNTEVESGQGGVEVVKEPATWKICLKKRKTLTAVGKQWT